MKIAVVGDCHIMERNPRVRKDNYFAEVLRKLNYIANENDKVIILGDLFHTFNNSDFVFYNVYNLMKRHEGKFKMIAGNHDFFHRNFDSLNRTTVGCLSSAGVLDLEMHEFKIDKLNFNVVTVDTPVEEVERDETNKKILLGHKYFEQAFCEKESLTREDIADLNYNLVFLGHDHKPYEEEYIGNSTLIRMGSLTRMDSQLYNRDRSICYYQLDSETGYYIVKSVPYKPVSECCIEGAFASKDTKKENTVSYIDIEKAINKMLQKADGNISLNKTLKEINATDEQIALIKEMYEVAGADYN